MGGETLRDVGGLAPDGLGSGPAWSCRVPVSPQAVSTGGSRRPKASGCQRQSQNGGRGAGEQVCTLDLGWEWSGEQKEFHSTDPQCWGAPSLGWEQVSVLKKGWGK